MLILAVEDDHALLHAIEGVLSDEGYQVETAERGDDGFLLAERGNYDLLVSIALMPIKGKFRLRVNEERGHPF